MQFCNEPGCGVLVRSGRCKTHAPRARLLNVAYAKANRWYSSSRWRRLRYLFLLDEPFCRACAARGLLVVAVDVDHIRKHNGDPGLFWLRANLQGLCKACHTRKTVRGE